MIKKYIKYILSENTEFALYPINKCEKIKK